MASQVPGNSIIVNTYQLESHYYAEIIVKAIELMGNTVIFCPFTGSIMINISHMIQLAVYNSGH